MSYNNNTIHYFDHAATTPLDKAVLEAMQPYFFEQFGNPSAIHQLGITAKKAIEYARSQVATVLMAQPENIVFTGSATEANNIAILGIVKKQNTGHIITVRTEHDSVLGPCTYLESIGYEVTYLDVNETGNIDIEELFAAIRPDTVLISIMYANNEIGTIHPIQEIGKKILRYRKKQQTQYPYFHTDACQAVNYLDMSVERLHVDLLTVNSSKIYGPKGTGALYIRNEVEIIPQTYGGGQEFGLRSGTENVPAIVGFGAAIEITEKNKEVEYKKQQQHSVYFWQELQKNFGSLVTLHGPSFTDNRLPNNLYVSFDSYEGEKIVLYLDAQGVIASTGSACSSKQYSSSHVLAALGYSVEEQSQGIRFTLGKGTTKKDIDDAVRALKKVIQILHT